MPEFSFGSSLFRAVHEYIGGFHQGASVGLLCFGERLLQFYRSEIAFPIRNLAVQTTPQGQVDTELIPWIVRVVPPHLGSEGLFACLCKAERRRIGHTRMASQ